MATPEETTPQKNAHMGGNQVYGLSSVRTANGRGRSSIPVSVADRPMSETYL
jgi:hypothetical protein